MDIPAITASSNYHLHAAFSILDGDVAESGEDAVSDRIIELLDSDENVKMLLMRNMYQAQVNDEAIEAMRKGWTFLKTVFGEAVALPLLGHAGIAAVVGAQRTLYGIGSERESVYNRISVPATIVANICDTLAEYNCVDGERVMTHLLNDIPLTTPDRETVTEVAKRIDYTVTKPN